MYNTLILLSARAFALIGFFSLSVVMEIKEFGEFALYFSIVQILSQVFSLQLGALFFRKGMESKHQKIFGSFLKSIHKISFVLSIASIALISLNLNLVAYIFISAIVAIQLITFEYARARINETIVFSLNMILSMQYLILSGIFYLLDSKGSLLILVSIDVVAYSVSIVAFGRILHLKRLQNINKNGFSRIIILWNKISRNLVLNSFSWYVIFNAPIIAGKYIVDSSEDFLELSVTMRMMVALSTISSTVCMTLQKNAATVYKSDFVKYSKLKKNIVKIVPIGLLALTILFVFAFRVSLGNNNNQTIKLIIDNVLGLAASGYLFTLIYSLSIILVAEEKFELIHNSMATGIAIYAVLFLAAMSSKVTFLNAVIIATLITLAYVYFRRLRGALHV